MIATLFSFKGRIGRLKFFLTYLLFDLLILLIAGLTAAALITDISTLNSNNIAATSTIFPLHYILAILAALFTIVWIKLAIIWKRARDIRGNTSLAWLYIGLIPLLIIPFVRYLALIVQTVLLLGFCFFPSKNQKNAVSPDVFGEPSSIPSSNLKPAIAYAEAGNDGQQEFSGVQSLLSEEVDLVARAKQLREAQSVRTPPARVKTKGPSQKSFGMRRQTTSFGTR